MAANGNNVRFNLDDEDNVEDIVNNGGEHNINGENVDNVNEHAAADGQQIPPLMIPVFGFPDVCGGQLCAQYTSFRLAWDGTKRGHTIPELVGTLEIH